MCSLLEVFSPTFDSRSLTALADGIWVDLAYPLYLQLYTCFVGRNYCVVNVLEPSKLRSKKPRRETPEQRDGPEDQPADYVHAQG
jgi:hypothetical protein